MCVIYLYSSTNIIFFLYIRHPLDFADAYFVSFIVFLTYFNPLRCMPCQTFLIKKEKIA